MQIEESVLTLQDAAHVGAQVLQEASYLREDGGLARGHACRSVHGSLPDRLGLVQPLAAQRVTHPAAPGRRRGALGGDPVCSALRRNPHTVVPMATSTVNVLA